MYQQALLALGLLPQLLSASVLHVRQSVDCSFSISASKGDTCQSFADSWGLDLATFKSLNPGVACPNLVADQDYCVVGTVSTVKPEPPKSTSQSTAKPTSTSTSKTTSIPPTTTSASPYSPTQPGLSPKCDKFHLVVAGDQCSTLQTKYSISAVQFIAWNPSITPQCDNLWLGYWVCVHIPGATVVPPPAPSSTKPANGITTPQPTQAIMVANCNKFQWVANGETCATISAKAGVSQADLLKWNPSIGSDCKGLWANAYACVGLLPAFSLKTAYHADCTGDIRQKISLPDGSGGMCLDTGCTVASVDIAAEGLCPGGQVQLSYWEKPGCVGQWYGYGYASRGTCRKLWSEGWKFKSLHVRCAKQADDCVTKKTCTYDLEPAKYLC